MRKAVRHPDSLQPRFSDRCLRGTAGLRANADINSNPQRDADKYADEYANTTA